MPYTLHFDEKSRVLLVRFGAVVTVKDLEVLRDDTLAFAQRHGNCDGIVDFTAATDFNVDMGYLRALGRRPRIMKGARRILVAPQPEVFGLSRMFGSHQADAIGEEPTVVTTPAEAYAVLGLEAPHFEPLVL